MKSHSLMKISWLRRPLLVAAFLAASVQLVSAEGNSADNRVTQVQQALKLKHFYYGDVDGNFDSATQSALLRFQFRNGLPGTGAMDDVTVGALTGISFSPKPVSANIAAQAERVPQIARPVEKDEDRIAASATVNAVQKPAFSASADASAQRPVPHAAFTVSVQSWADQHRAPVEDRVEVRRAIPIAPVDPMDRPEASPEALTTVVAHFTGQDGHVYTYYRKIRTSLPEMFNSPGSLGIAVAVTP